MPTQVRTSLKSVALLNDARLNKGAAFTREERKAFELVAHLPYAIHTLEVQLKRATEQLNKQPTDIAKHAFLVSLREQNEILFYRLLLDNLTALLPIIYTPTVSDAVKDWSRLFRKPEGAYLCLADFDAKDPDCVKKLLKTHGLSGPERAFDLVIVTDAGAILGIGDQGVGGIAIAIGKAEVYSAGAGVDPARILSVVIDAGTDNKEHLEDDLYLGWRHPRVRDGDYDLLVEQFVSGVQDLWKGALIHFEDFGRENAARFLDKYRPHLPVFNDDIQGTGCVVLGALLASMKKQGSKLSEQKFVIQGAGTAGMGISEWIVRAMKSIDNVDEKEARSKFWLVDKQGLLTNETDGIVEHQKPFLRKASESKDWKTSGGQIDLAATVKNVKPTVIIGTSAQKDSWTEELVQDMVDAAADKIAIFLPLSNPTKLEEAKPEDIIQWSKGRCHVATGSPFGPVKNPNGGDDIIIAEANNALCYPTLGFSTIISGAKSLSDSLILAGIKSLAEMAPILSAKEGDANAALLPDLGEIREVTVNVAKAVVRQALKDGVATADGIPDGKNDQELEKWIKSKMWVPEYPDLVYDSKA